MKKKICILLIGMFLMFSAFGCGKTVVDENGIEHPIFGRFITLNKEKYTSYDGSIRNQFIVYDKDTKIMYIIDNCRHGFSISPFYVMNSENEPVIGVYNGDLENVE